MNKPNIQQQVAAFTSQHRIPIAVGLNNYKQANTAGELPRHSNKHWRGLWHAGSGRVYGQFADDARLLPAPRTARNSQIQSLETMVLCHCKPLDDSHVCKGSEDRYPDIPDRLDIYLLLRCQFSAIAFSGATQAGIITRTESTYPFILKLRDWEQDRQGGRYRRVRGRSQLIRSLGREPTVVEQERLHAKSALKVIGLSWAPKPRDRHALWPQCLSDIGLKVELTNELSPIKHRAP